MTNTTQAYADVNGVRLHYAEAGAGDLVILLHGFPEFWYTWRPQIAVLASEHHVVAPDMRGYNLSAKPPNVADYRIETVARDVVGLIDHFGVAQASIVAHDWGAGVAWSVAQQFPERVSKLAVLQVPPAAAWRDNITLKQLFRSWYMMFFQLPGIPEWLISRKNFALLEKMFRETTVRKNTFTDEDIEAYKEALRQPGALTSSLNYYRANVRRLIAHSSSHAAQVDGLTDPGEVQAQRDGRIKVSTLFIFGEQDFAIVPATAHKVDRYIDAPFCELRIPDSGHWVQNEAPEEVNAALVEFLRA